ncbi:MAG: hypothetical protein Q8R97_09030 [Brevundimonas sp.]|uniref:hypothetical protein n=1 Tax=Brevundimonas sp. TaxID=1871086 RepID=UPI00274CCD02|nr:hypothetical protein [Brevundimonas sp.]MDP3401249.1 hypothetical protein [Brevundimonas sp.]MDZ4109908.1 hypothetical protein [Brevundimonas sp.]
MRLSKILLASAAAMALASCGSAEVASPGEGNFGGGTGGGTGGGGGGGGTGGAATDCPTGFANVGTITVAGGTTLRNCQLPSLIVGNLVVAQRAGTIYSVSGRTDVGQDRGANPAAPLAGASAGILTVEPGVTIFGSGGLDYIVVNRGSQIFAEGTATSPVIFTSRQSVEGTTGVDSIGQWGGLVILGRAPIAACPAGVTPPNIACEAQIEGTSAFYGGNTIADNSGRLRYFRLMHSGFQILPGNELNGITLGGVGNGTTIEYVQVHNSSDDGIEPFGGTVNMKYIVLTGNDDDSFDTDTGYRGNTQFMIIRQAPTRGDRGLESSSAGNQALFTRPIVSNMTVIGRTDGAGGDAILLNTGHALQLYNSVVAKPSGTCFDIDDAATVTNGPTFNSVYLSCGTTFRADGNQDAATSGIFATGVNNSAGASSLNGVINGANETARPATPVAGVNSFFTNTTYIGAVRDSSDTWYAGWSCGIAAGSTC